MKTIIILYYIFYILSGGFRHFGIDFVFWNNLGNHQLNEIPNVLIFIDSFLLLYSFFIAFRFPSKFHHLIFGSLLFCVDLFFQNKVSFISSLILPHLFPFFVYFYLRYEGSEKLKLIGYIGILLVSVGYLTSFYAKYLSGWGNWDHLVLRGFIFEFNEAYSIPTLLGEQILVVKNHFFWKALDWMVLFFQGTFIIVFLKKSTFHILSIFSVVFHFGVILTLGIGVFYIYILFYAFIYHCELGADEKEDFFSDLLVKRFKSIVLGVLFFTFLYYKGDPHFFYRLIPRSIYLSAEYIFNLICVFTFLIVYFKVIKSKCTNQLTKWK